MHRFRIAGKASEVEDLDNAFRSVEKLKWYGEPLAAGDWEGYIYRHPRPYRLQCFIEIMNRVPDSEYWRMLGGVWVDAEVPNVNRAIWLDLFTAARSGRENLMTPDEHAALSRLPELVRIYRGAPVKYARGMAWTTDQERAVWFAERYAGTNAAKIISAVLPKAKLLAYFTDRKESEAVVDPRQIRFEVLD